MQISSRLRILIVCQLLLAATQVATTRVAAESVERDAWLQWRGPSRDGSIAGAEWPSSLSEAQLTRSWSVPLGESYSGPIVAADRVFVTETRNSSHEVVRALDRSTGAEIWQTQWPGAMRVPFFAASNGSWIRATPAHDGRRLYVAGMRDVLVCLDEATGEIVWKRDFVGDTRSPLPQFGCVSSPLLRDGSVFMQAGASLTRLDGRTGQIAWQTLRDSGGMRGGAFSSPVYAEIAGVPQLVVQTRARLAGVDPESGQVLWSTEVAAFRGMNILTPTVIGNAVFTSSYGGRSKLFRISRSDRSWSVAEGWTHKSQAYMSSPVVIDGHIYLHLRNQRFICLDAETGRERWTSRPFGKYCSMVTNGTKILALDQTGELLLIKASPESFQLLGRRRVASDSWAHLAVAGDDVFVRDLRALSAFRWQP